MRQLGWMLALAGLVLGLVGCGGGDQEVSRAGEPVPIQREFTGQQGPVGDRGFFVVQRPEAWQALWGDRAAPAVDFATSTVLVALMGQQPTAGYSIDITDVRATGTRIIAYVDETRPNRGDVVAQVITTPFAMVVVPKLTQPVAFNVEGTTPLVVQDYFSGPQSLAVNPQTLVIRDQAGWQAFWRTNFGAAAIAPTVDFNQYMAVAVLAGQRQTTGYTVRIAGVDEQPQRLEVRYRVLAPAPGTVVTQTVTSPYAVALISQSTQAVAFVPITTPVVTAAVTTTPTQ